MVAFDGLVLNAVNGNPLQCDSSGLSCMVSDFDGDIRAQTLIETGTTGACAVTFASQEPALDCELVSIQHIFILQKLYCTFSFLSIWFLDQNVCTCTLRTTAFESQLAGQKFLKEYASAMNFWWLPVWCRRQQVGGEWW
ncbi:TPA: hypothetical protein ACH3X2_011686 [Trebouxia sp. C0005]